MPVDSAAAANTNLGAGLTNRQYGEICEILGTSVPAEFASQATNCTSPDTEIWKFLHDTHDGAKAKVVAAFIRRDNSKCMR